jgi:uracil-DNA glycosylase family 4
MVQYIRPSFSIGINPKEDLILPLSALKEEIIQCNKCPRLREWSERQEGTNPQYRNEKYWAKPVPGDGDTNASLLIVGLAPGAHGANRTGTPFAGDTAGSFLYDALKKHGYSNGEQLTAVFITNAVKCAPPENKPIASEFHHFREYLIQEIGSLPNLKTVLALGEKAFYEVIRIFSLKKSQHKFAHGIEVPSSAGNPFINGSYHPSKYNLYTKRMNEEKMNQIFMRKLSEANGNFNERREKA